MVWCCFVAAPATGMARERGRTRLHFFLIFREDFIRTFIAGNKFFVYRLLYYYYQTDTPPYLFAEPETDGIYAPLKKDKTKPQHPCGRHYNLIVSVLYYLLVIINRAYAQTYRLPVKCQKQLRIQIQGLTRKTYPNDTARSRICLICFG